MCGLIINVGNWMRWVVLEKAELDGMGSLETLHILVLFCGKKLEKQLCLFFYE
jgi:hypothetical protein